MVKSSSGNFRRLDIFCMCEIRCQVITLTVGLNL
jgi:hypothetical protein